MRQPIKVRVAFGLRAVAALHAERQGGVAVDAKTCIRTYHFDTVAELNAFILGVEDATGFHDTFLVEDI